MLESSIRHVPRPQDVVRVFFQEPRGLTIFPRHAGIAAVIFLTVSFRLPAQPVSAGPSPATVLNAMERVADWQLANPSAQNPGEWAQGVADVGMMALVGISGDTKYHNAMLAKGGTNGWGLNQFSGGKHHVADQCEGQAYAELYFLHRENKMIAPLRAQFNAMPAGSADAPGPRT